MRLSEAIRKGSVMKPQGWGNESMTDTATSCALGAACDGLGIKRESSQEAYVALQRRYPLLLKVMPGPCPGMSIEPLLHTIFRLNDQYKPWTREDIADWVELVEDEEELKAQGFGLTPDL